MLEGSHRVKGSVRFFSTADSSEIAAANLWAHFSPPHWRDGRFEMEQKCCHNLSMVGTTELGALVNLAVLEDPLTSSNEVVVYLQSLGLAKSGRRLFSLQESAPKP